MKCVTIDVLVFLHSNHSNGPDRSGWPIKYLVLWCHWKQALEAFISVTKQFPCWLARDVTHMCMLQCWQIGGGGDLKVPIKGGGGQTNSEREN